MSPTERTLKLFKEKGFTSQVVERWNPYAGVRVDLFGVIDLVCVQPGYGIIGVQTTSGSGHSSRCSKAAAEPRIKTWLLSGGQFVVCSWRKLKPRGVKKVRWTEKIAVARVVNNSIMFTENSDWEVMDRIKSGALTDRDFTRKPAPPAEPLVRKSKPKRLAPGGLLTGVVKLTGSLLD